MAKNEQGVNYIKHLLVISEKFIDDNRLSPLHISLYYALFQSWNLAMFRNPISVCREELMQASKIGSANTYTKCLKELDVWNYIKYYPSHNPHKGSQIYLYNFDKTTDNATDISTNKSNNKTIEKSSAKTSVKVLIPSINNSNSKNNSNNINNHEHQRSKNNRKSSAVNGRGNKKEKNSAKKEMPTAFADTNKKQNTGRQRNPPTITELQNYFAGRKWPDIEAEKFYNYYQSNGWLVGGKTPMQNWKAAANNWILNSEKFSNDKTKPKAGKLHTTGNKDYSEPL